MSEFQYYEFVAIDRPLTLAAQKQLRAITSRATITATRMVNIYEWGDFKGDPHALVARYFDAFLYYANWGTRELMLRLPVSRIDTKVAFTFLARRSGESRRISSVATASIVGKHLILSLGSADESGDDWNIEDGALSVLTPIRNELMAGDYRALHLAWLLRRQAGEIGSAVREPGPRPSMKRMTGSQRALADFLRIDIDQQ